MIVARAGWGRVVQASVILILLLLLICFVERCLRSGPVEQKAGACRTFGDDCAAGARDGSASSRRSSRKSKAYPRASTRRGSALTLQ